MKKGTLFKILTLFLTFAIFSCCSGCLFALGLQLKENEERHQRLIEKQKERKAQADALIPEIDGYIFEALPQSAFANQEDWESKGFLGYDDLLENNGQKCEYYCNFIKTDECYIFDIKLYRVNGGYQDDIDIGKIIIDKQEYEERLSKYFELFSECGATFCYDNTFFILFWMPMLQDGMRDLYAPPALFLLDFENNNLYYVGYAKGWFEYEIEHGYFVNGSNICYKLTKES